MHRPARPLAAILAVSAAPALLALLAFAPAASAAVTAFAADAGLEPGTRRSWPLDGGQGDSFTLDWQASGANVDVFVVQGRDETAIDNASSSAFAFQALNQSSGRSHVSLASAGPWVLVVDNSAQPPGGASGDAASTVHVAVDPVLVDVSPPQDTGSGEPEPAPQASDEEAPTLWNTLMFDAHHWTVGGIGLASVALWMIVLCAVALYKFDAPLPKLALLAGGAAAVAFLWKLLPYIGPLTEIGPPMLAGLGVGYLAVRWSSSLRTGLQLAFVAAVLGAFAGVLLGYAALHLWSDPRMLVLGGRRFTDALFTLPGFAVTGVLLFKLVPDIVHAIDEANQDEAAAKPAQGTMQGDSFLVDCLRCGTEIKVDRSMKRFRVATDRYEFACPNCQYWMEWAEPGQGAAAA